MRLNYKKALETMKESDLTEEAVCIRTGLSRKSLQAILENGFCSADALVRIAEALGTTTHEIAGPDITGNMENVIEFTRDSNKATISFSQGRYISRIRRLAAERSEECQILAENKDGSIYAQIPTAWVKIVPSRELSEEQREMMADALRRNILDKETSRNENM